MQPSIVLSMLALSTLMQSCKHPRFDLLGSVRQYLISFTAEVGQGQEGRNKALVSITYRRQLSGFVKYHGLAFTKRSAGIFGI